MMRKQLKRAHRRREQPPSPAGGKAITARPGSLTLGLTASLPAALLLLAGVVLAGPEGGRVVGGQGSIARPDPNTTLINQTSSHLSVDWSSFNIARHETVQFNQPSANAAALNRIHDQNPSQIFGALRANGQVLLVNPNGVFFGPTASVNVNALIASGLDISTADFMAGRQRFQAPPGTAGGMVVNQGMLQAATGGAISLLGGAVRNEGVILASAGQVNLLAGNRITMDFDGDGLIQFTVDKEVLQNAHDLDDAISNTGEIQADGGAVLLRGSAAKDVFSNVVNNQGVIRAGRIENEGGQIRLVAEGPANSLINTGTLDAEGRGGDGGRIAIHADDAAILAGDSVLNVGSRKGGGGTAEVLGEQIALLDNTAIKASGATGGGTVLVGGDYQGANHEIRNAQRVAVGEEVSILANARTQGDGGKVIIWADGATRYYGEISATGGERAGDGGFVEISAGRSLAGHFVGRVDTTAANGNTGTLLLDPENITIRDGTGDSADDNDLLDTSFIAVGGASAAGTLAASDMPADFTLYESELEGIAATTNIALSATNNITLEDLSDNNLNLAQTSAHSVTFTADADSDGMGEFMMDSSDSITTAGGAVSIRAAGVTLGGISTGGGALTGLWRSGACR